MALQHLARTSKGHFAKAGTPGTTPEILARGPSGKMLPKSALGQFSDQLAKSNGNKTIDQNGFQISDLAKMKSSGLMQLKDPLIMAAILRRNLEITQEVLDLTSEQKNFAQRTYQTITGKNKQLISNQAELENLFDLDLVKLEKTNASLSDMTPFIRETTKYTQINAEILNKILDKMQEEAAVMKAIPFKLDEMKSIEKSCCSCDRNGNEREGGGFGGNFGGSSGGGIGAGLLAGFLGWKLFKSLRGAKPVLPRGGSKTAGEASYSDSTVEGPRVKVLV